MSEVSPECAPKRTCADHSESCGSRPNPISPGARIGVASSTAAPGIPLAAGLSGWFERAPMQQQFLWDEKEAWTDAHRRVEGAVGVQ
jgi:hypothetical protein